MSIFSAEITSGNRFRLEEETIENRSKLFYKIDDYLNRCNNNNIGLNDPAVAKIVSNAIDFYDNKVIDLIAYCIMPNHVHLMFTDLSIENINKQSWLANIL